MQTHLSFLITRLVVLLIAGGGAGSFPSIARGALSAVSDRVTLYLLQEAALLGTAGPLAGTALGVDPATAHPGSGVIPPVIVRDEAGVAALLSAILVIKPTVTLLPLLHYLVATECTISGLKAILSPIFSNGI